MKATLKNAEKLYLQSLTYSQVRKVLDQFSHYYATFDMKKLVDLWADREDCFYAAPWGCYEGIRGIRSCFLEDYGDRNDPRFAEVHKGCVLMHTIDTELIVAADDFQTARAVAEVQGSETYGPNVWDPFYRNKGCGVSNKISVDLILENGKWKLWHLREWSNYHHPIDVSWTDVGRYQGFVFKETTSADTPPLYPGKFYNPDYTLYPESLELIYPYETFEEIAPGFGKPETTETEG